MALDANEFTKYVSIDDASCDLLGSKLMHAHGNQVRLSSRVTRVWRKFDQSEPTWTGPFSTASF